MCLEIIYLIIMYLKDFALNNLQRLICHKTKPDQTKQNPPSSNITEASPSDCFMTYTRPSLEEVGVWPFTDMQLVYSTASAMIT